MVYLDNAATTFPKPYGVAEEVYRCMNVYCGNPGRGSHYMARAAGEKIFEARESLSSLVRCPSPENTVFTLNTTYALNIAIKSQIREGMHVLISDMEHNSVLRPIAEAARRETVTYSVFPTFGGDETEILRYLNYAVKENTKLLICQHSSNICGTVLPLKKIGELCKKRGIYFIVDAAQSIGIFDIDMISLGIDAMCVPSHKGLYGPQGAGAVLFRDVNAVENAYTLIEGGSGSFSNSQYMPDFLPDRFEAGTAPTPALAGLCKGIEFVRRNTPRAIRCHEESLSQKMKADLSEIRGLDLYRADLPSSIILFNLKGKSCTYVAEELDKFGICVRSGLHCSPLAHRTLGTGQSGAVRISFGAFNDIKDVKYTVDAINKIAKQS